MSSYLRHTNENINSKEEIQKNVSVIVPSFVSVDSFSRFRISNSNTLFDSKLVLTDGSMVWQTITAGSASTIWSSQKSNVKLIANSSGTAIRQTYEYFRYQPGKSHLIISTGVFGTGVDGVTKRIGYYDNNDGIFFQQNGLSGMSIVKRAFGTDTTISRYSWNVDTFNGKGVSEFNWDETKATIFWIDMEWLGVGNVRTGIISDSNIYIGHIFRHANQLTEPYMKTATLPLRYEITNTGSSTAELMQICNVVISEDGNIFDRGYTYTQSNGINGQAIGAGNRYPVMAIRSVTSFVGQTGIHGNIFIQDIDLLVTNSSVKWELVYNPILPSSAEWVAVSSSSIAECATGITNIAGGISIIGGFAGVESKRTSISDKVFTRHPVCNDYSGTTGSVIALVIEQPAGAQASNINASLTWEELY